MAGVFLPAGYQLTLTAEATKAGGYVQFGSPDTYVPVSAGNSTTIGPFDGPRQYDVFHLSTTQALAVRTYVDAELAEKHPLVDDIVTYSANGAITNFHSIGKITKAGVCALTLAAPAVADDGKYMNIISTTDYAHTITATDLINNGTVGSPLDLITFAAYRGAGVTLMAVDEVWVVISNRACTITGS